MRSFKKNRRTAASRANAITQQVQSKTLPIVDSRPSAIRQRNLQSEINAVLQRKILSQKAPHLGVVQRNAWEKKNGVWIKKTTGDHLEVNVDSEKKPGPPNNIGKDGWIYSSNIMRYFDTTDKYETYIREYKKYLELDKIACTYKGDNEENKKELEKAASEQLHKLNSSGIKITGIEQEKKFLEGSTDAMEFKDDITNNYLLWSVPLHAGKNMVAQSGLKLDEVSGERAAEIKAEEGKGYMMKQTQEHFEALTEIKSSIEYENLQPSQVLSQYGSSDPNTYIMKRVDPLHQPRDPQYHTDFIDILKLIDNDEKLKNIKDCGGGDLSKKLTTLNTPNKIKLRVNEIISDSNSFKDFNIKFYKEGTEPSVAEQLIKFLSESRSAKADRDQVDEVTRAKMMHGEVPLVGGRQATFNSVWGPKSTEVVEKTAKGNNSVESHGLKYHYNPQWTIQATAEFPPYRDLLKKILAPVIKEKNDIFLTKYYNKAIESLDTIIGTIGKIAQQGQETLQELAIKRDAYMKTIDDSNNTLIENMKYIRKNL